MLLLVLKRWNLFKARSPVGVRCFTCFLTDNSTSAGDERFIVHHPFLANRSDHKPTSTIPNESSIKFYGADFNFKHSGYKFSVVDYLRYLINVAEMKVENVEIMTKRARGANISIVGRLDLSFEFFIATQVVISDRSADVKLNRKAKKLK